MRKLIKPERLRIGDKVAIVSLSRGMLGDQEFIHKYKIAKERLEKMGFEVVAMKNALKGSEFLYEHPELRAQDLMDAFEDKSIKAIFNAIGGDDTIRLLPYMDFDIIRKNPKIFTGFSDTTVNHMMMYQAGVVSYYGLSVMNQISEYVKINDYTKWYFDNILLYPKDNLELSYAPVCSYEKDKIWWSEENQNQLTPVQINNGYEILMGKGRVEGELLGGCIDTFIYLMGTSLWPTKEEWIGKILLLETSEMDMPEVILAEILRNLYAQGILKVIKGIIIGKPPVEDKVEKYKHVYQQILINEMHLDHLAVLYNVSIGHSYPTGILPLGLKYRIDCDQVTLTLLESATK